MQKRFGKGACLSRRAEQMVHLTSDMYYRSTFGAVFATFQSFLHLASGVQSNELCPTG